MSYSVPQIKTVNVERYVLPLREGGSMPGLVEANDGCEYVIKFRGAAQGPKVLIAELLCGEIARALGLNVPELVFAMLDESYGRLEPDQEIQDQLKASTGLNIGLRFLECANTFDPNVTKVDPVLASRIVWLDCLITNVDRTVRNANMLNWKKELWLIDHGAALFFHHNWANPPAEQALKPFVYVKDHVLLAAASALDHADNECRAVLTEEVISGIVSLIPDDWLMIDAPFESAGDHRQAYAQYFLARVANSAIFVKEAKHARQ
jgi:hypothetical protein